MSWGQACPSLSYSNSLMFVWLVKDLIITAVVALGRFFYKSLRWQSKVSRATSNVLPAWQSHIPQGKVVRLDSLLSRFQHCYILVDLIKLAHRFSSKVSISLTATRDVTFDYFKNQASLVPPLILWIFLFLKSITLILLLELCTRSLKNCYKYWKLYEIFFLKALLILKRVVSFLILQ